MTRCHAMGLSLAHSTLRHGSAHQPYIHPSQAMVTNASEASTVVIEAEAEAGRHLLADAHAAEADVAGSTQCAGNWR